MTGLWVGLAVIWVKDRAYLADDYGTAFADGAALEVKIIRELHVPRVVLGEDARRFEATGSERGR